MLLGSEVVDAVCEELQDLGHHIRQKVRTNEQGGEVAPTVAPSYWRLADDFRQTPLRPPLTLCVVSGFDGGGHAGACPRRGSLCGLHPAAAHFYAHR